MSCVSNFDVCTQKVKVKEKVSRYDPSVYEKESKGNHPGLMWFELVSGHNGKLKCAVVYVGMCAPFIGRCSTQYWKQTCC